ncbi:MAG TPA: hypothetical protein PK612_02215, partial [Bacilli bacterium]|nr:hypothetical protein [Bacilli bacterium]
MFIYFDRNGVLQEVINDKAARLGDLNANEIYVYVDEVELDDIWLTLKRPDGTLSVEKSFIANKVVREIPYDPKRDMKFFKDFKEYEFYKFTITDEITSAGVYQATIRMTYEDTLSALGVLVFKAETGVIKSDQNITQAQYDYLIWYVGSWQGQIGDLEEAMGIAEAGILGLQNRMNVAEQDINKIEDGTTVVKKALKDDLGNTIKSTYANKLDLVYSSSNNRIAITLKSYDGTPIDADLIDLPKATTSADGLLAKEDKVKINNIATDIASMGATKQSLSEKNQINGYAGLDGNAKIPSSLLPDSVLGQLEYKGTFNPNNGYPSSPEKGWFYIAIADALISGVDYQVGDWAVFNGSTWDKIDNTDAVMSVNGKLGVVVLNGTDIPVGNGDTWTIEQRIVNIYAELNNRYTKAQTYSNTEIEQRITDLLGMVNLQDTAVEFSAGVYDLSYNGLAVSTFDYSLVSPYNWVILRVLVGTQAEYTIFKPSEATNGVGINLPLTQKDVYAEIMRNGSNFEFSLKKKNDNTLDTTTATMKAWGIKLDGIDASDISYNNETVESALDSLLVPEYITATHEALQSEITATNNIEIKDDSGELVKITGNTPTNLVSNSELLIDSNSDGVPDGFSYNNATDISLTNGIAKFTATATAGRLEYRLNDTDTKTIYVYARIKSISNTTYLRTSDSNSHYAYHSGNSEYELLSDIYIASSTYNFIAIGSSASSGWTPISVDYIGAYNVSDMIRQGVKNDDGIPFADLTNEEIKDQLDIW